MKIRWWHVGLLIALVLALLSPLASPWPDGLERVAEDYGFIDKAEEPLYHIIPDYIFPGVQNEALAAIIAGLVGTALVFGVAYGLGQLVKARRTG